MTRPSLPTFGQGLNGGAPSDWADTAAVDGDRPPWSRAPRGARFQKIVTVNQTEWYEKIKDDTRNDDWVLDRGTISQYVDYTDFTDGGGATGTLVLTATIPIGAIVTRCFLVNNSDATGVSTLTIQVGDGTDADRYTTGTPSVATAANILDLGVPSGTAVHVASKSVTVTLTEDDDFADVTAWSATVVLQYTGAAV